MVSGKTTGVSGKTIGASGKTTGASGKTTGRQAALHAALLLASLATVAPLVWTLRTAVTPPVDVFRSTLAPWPEHPTLDNLRTAFRLQPVAAWLVNSVALSLVLATVKLVLAVPAGFAFARLRFPGRDLAFAAVIGTMTVPSVITLIPAYLLMVRLGLYDTMTGVAIPAAGHCGFAVFFLRQAFRALPAELFEAARVDGAGVVRQMLSVALPNVGPALAAVFAISFLGAWNMYLWPQLMLETPAHKTLAIGLKLFATTGDQAGQWGPLMATALLGAVPPLLLFLLAQRQMVSGFVSSGLR